MAVLIAKKFAPPAVVYSFNMTAGQAGGFVQGYESSGAFGSPFGSIDAEPIPDHALVFLLSGLSKSIAFSGDAVSLLSGLTVWVDGVEFPFDAADWNFNSGTGNTGGTWDDVGPAFVDTQSYFVEIK